MARRVKNRNMTHFESCHFEKFSWLKRRIKSDLFSNHKANKRKIDYRTYNISMASARARNRRPSVVSIERAYDHSVVIILLGDQQSGKTDILDSYAGVLPIAEDGKKRRAVGVRKKMLTLNDRKIQTRVLDTAGRYTRSAKVRRCAIIFINGKSIFWGLHTCHSEKTRRKTKTLFRMCSTNERLCSGKYRRRVEILVVNAFLSNTFIDEMSPFPIITVDLNISFSFFEMIV